MNKQRISVKKIYIMQNLTGLCRNNLERGNCFNVNLNRSNRFCYGNSKMLNLTNSFMTVIKQITIEVYGSSPSAVT